MITCATLILGLHLVSHHNPELPLQNNTNPGVYAECDGWTVGAYKNTLDRTSAYAGYTWHWGPASLGAGAITGYRVRTVYGQEACMPGKFDRPDIGNPCWVRLGGNNSRVQPMLAPALTLGPARITYLPKLGPWGVSVTHLSMQHQF